MATGYEDWIRYRVTAPSTALERLYLHIQILQEMASGARTMADGVAYDPQPIMNMLTPTGFLMIEMNRLEGMVNNVGKAALIPTRRVDGGNLAPPDTSLSGG